MKEFRFLASRALCWREHWGAASAEYLGPITRASLANLAPQIWGASDGANGLIVRVDRALLVHYDVPDLPPTSVGSPPAALIVRDGMEYELWAAFCRKAALSGVRRAAFYPWELVLANVWLKHQLAGYLEEHPRLRPPQRDERLPL